MSNHTFILRYRFHFCQTSKPIERLFCIGAKGIAAELLEPSGRCAVPMGSILIRHCPERLRDMAAILLIRLWKWEAENLLRNS